MNDSLFFVRHGKPNLPFDSYETIPFSLLCNLGNGTQNPGIDTKKTEALIATMHAQTLFSQKNITIIASPSLRAQETADLFSKCLSSKEHVITLPDLQEVLFDLAHIYHPETEGINMQALNHAVLQAMMNGEHAESIQSVFRRIETLFERLSNVSGPILCVTHDFFMRGVELYIHHKGDLSSIAPEELFQTQTNHPCRGFETTKDLSVFKEIS